MPLSQLTWPEWAGIIGAVSGVPALFIQLIQYLHSKPRLRVDVSPECIIIRDEFKVKNDCNPDEEGYRYATHVVITNVGQMTASILKIEIRAKNYGWIDTLLSKLPVLKKTRRGIISHDKAIIDQTYKTPFTLDAGHVWIGIVDALPYRENLHHFPHVYLEIKTSHKKKPQVKKIKLAA